ncbi:pentatricopeptide repeat-containing protein At4g20770-like isoform X1 [Selaginella moellendorffii]|nr:pentatricopeptide repeat-containing protein At4g20770-like isoform X1 [Selaginella moellendorffii]|eukprot:XP_024540327.1 pentatricopeptide repeat-containing protein At4g20770-like isoform X1 [Selaginella moellendorffii]
MRFGLVELRLARFHRSYSTLQEQRSANPQELRRDLDRLCEVLDPAAVDRAHLTQLLKQCGILQSTSEARRLHSWIAKTGLDRDPFFANNVVQMYSRCGSIDEAARVFHATPRKNARSCEIMLAAFARSGDLDSAKQMFDAMPEPGVPAWNSMIAAHFHSGDSIAALRFFQRMMAEGIRPNPRSFVAALDACSRLEEGDFIHEPAIAVGLASDAIVGFSLVGFYRRCHRLDLARKVFDKVEEITAPLWTQMIAAYAKAGHLLEARALFDGLPEKDSVSWTCIIAAYAHRGRWIEAKQLFDEMPGRDVIAWNAMISANAQSGRSDQALELLLLMDLDGVHPNSVTFLSALEACTNLSDASRGSKLHTEGMLGSGIENSRKVSNALINMYGKCRELGRAKAVFDGMSDRDTVSWTTMLASFAENGDLEQASRAFDRIPERQCVAFNSMLAAYAQNGHIEEAKQLYDDAIHEPDIVAFTTLLTAFAQHGRGEQALCLLRAGDLEGLEMDLVSFVGILDACACCGALNEGRSIHQEAVLRGFQDDVTIGSALVNMYGKCGQVEPGREVFDGMPWRNSITWNAMLTAYAQNGHSAEALELFPVMILEGAEPSEVTFITLLSACAQAGLLQDGLRVFALMERDFGVARGAGNAVCLVDLLGRAGRLEAAEEMFAWVPVEERDTAWTALWGSCKIHGDGGRGVRAAESVLALDPVASTPYSLLTEALVMPHLEIY